MGKKKEKSIYHFSWAAIIILILGLVGGGATIGYGIYRASQKDENYIEIRDEETVKDEINKAYDKIDKLRKSRENEKSGTEKYSELTSSILSAEADCRDLEAELINIQNGLYSDLNKEVSFDAAPLVISGALMILLGATICVSILNRKKTRIESVDSEKKTKENK